MIPAFITSPDDAGFQQSLSRCRRQGSDWHMCRDTFGGHTKVIVITMVFRERPRHGGVAASNWATRRHSQRIKQASPNPSITYLRSRISCCLSLNNVVCDLIIASCLLSHTGKWHVCCNDSPQSSFAMCPLACGGLRPPWPCCLFHEPHSFHRPRCEGQCLTSACSQVANKCVPTLFAGVPAPFPALTVTTMPPPLTVTTMPPSLSQS